MTRTILLLLTLLLVVCPSLALADPPEADKQAEALLAAAAKHVANENRMRTRLAYLQVLQLQPQRMAALLGLARWGSAEEQQVCRLWCQQTWPDREAVTRLGPLPKRGEGKATRLLAVYLGLSASATSSRMPSLTVGGPLRAEHVLAVGLDADGKLVPVEIELVSPGKGLEAKDGAVRAVAAALPSSITVRDKRSGLTQELRLRVVGPPARVSIWSRTQRVGKGDLLHLGAGLYDAAGGRLWARTLKWSAVDAAGKPLAPGKPLRDTASHVPGDVPFEPHRNLVIGPRAEGDFIGKLTVTLEEPVSGKRDQLKVEVVAEGTNNNADRGAKLGWAASWEAGLARAKKEKKPILVFFEGDW